MKLFSWALVALGLSAVLRAVSDTATSGLAIVSYIGFGLAVVLTVLSFTHKNEPEQPIELSDSEYQELRQVKANQGTVHAVKKLREDHPGLGLMSAKLTVDGIE